MQRIQAPRGMNDILPKASSTWLKTVRILEDLLTQYGYAPIYFPLVEATALFERSIGAVTDIVEKEMYTFADLNGDSLTLRPEGTAPCVRACLEHGLLHNTTQRLFYSGPMFRHERPQKGRYRQFHQFGVECFGFASAAAETELLLITSRLFKTLGLTRAKLLINTIGLPEERARYKEALVTYFSAHKDVLDEDSIKRLERNPMRILDSKNPALKSIIAAAPKCMDFLGQASKEHFDTVCNNLTEAGIPFTVDTTLVRGLDYYCHTVFEWVTDALGAQGTICAGGRYDLLVEQLGGNATPAAGFGLGIERLLHVLEAENAVAAPSAPDVYCIGNTPSHVPLLQMAENIRSLNSKLVVLTDLAGNNLKKAFKRADNAGARFACIIGEEEINNGTVSIKKLATGEQKVLTLPEAVQWVSEGG